MSNVSEYLQEESRDVISGAELEMFYNSVDRLRDDVDRLRARVDAFKNK
jgi:ubiquinone biosynthesis protein UbiJ